MLYSLVEMHNDGSWWYHPGCTFGSEKEAEEEFKRRFWYDLKRKHTVFKHEEPMYQEWSTCTFDFKVFGLGGIVQWPASRAGEFQ